MPLWRVYIPLTDRAQLDVLRSWTMFEHYMYQKSIPKLAASSSSICETCSSHLWGSLKARFFRNWGLYPQAQPPNWKTIVTLFIWVITFDLSSQNDPASSYVTAGLVLRIIWPLRPHYYAKLGTFSGAIVFLSQRKNSALNVFEVWAFYIRRVLKIASRKFKNYYNTTRITSISYEKLCTIMKIFL